MRRSANPLALLLCLCAAGCSVGQSPQTIAAHKIADALPQAIGPAAHYDVQVSGGALELARGRARHIHIVGQDVQIAPMVTLDTLTLDAQDVSFDTQAKRVDTIKSTEFSATIGQAHLDAYLVQTHPNLSVALGPGDLSVALPVSVGPLHTTVRVSGILQPTTAGGNTLDFVADRARLGLLPVPAFAVNAALSAVNPVLDLSHVRVPLGIRRADVESGKLTIRGSAQIENLSRG